VTQQHLNGSESGVPSGKCLHNYGKSPFLMGKLWKDPPFFMGKSTLYKWPFSIANCKRLPEGNETPFLAVFMGKLWENDDKSSHFMVDFDVYWCHKASCEKRPKMNNTVFPGTFTFCVLMLWIAYTVDYSGPSIELVCAPFFLVPP